MLWHERPGRRLTQDREPSLTSDVLVDLTGQLSNPSVALQRMLDGKKSLVRRTSAGSAPHSTKQQQVRLPNAQQAEPVQRHRDGSFKKELARAYGIHVETVRAIIRRAAPQP